MSENTFDNIAFFDGLSKDECDLLKELFVPCDFDAGSMLFEQGETARNLYIVVDGEVEVRFNPDDGPPLVVARVLPGEIVGWSSALRSLRYTSGAYAVQDSQLLRVQGNDLRNICERYPTTGAVILDHLAAVIAERLRNTHPEVKAMLESALGLVKA